MKISVVTICYNSGQYLERAINSVLIQNYNNWEHIVIDGGSTDETLSILQRYKHLRWISEPDKGQSDAMNKGFALSSGNIIIYLNADDEINSGMFKTVVNHFKLNSSTDILVMDLNSITEGKSTITTPSTSLKEILHFEPCRFPLNPVSYAYKRSLQQKIGTFPINNHYAMDYWFLLRAYLFGKVSYAKFTGGNFYFDGNNKSADWSNARMHLKLVRDEFVWQNFYRKSILRFNFRRLKTKIHYLWLGLKKRGVPSEG